MNRNIKITLCYDGSKFDGWQRQGNTNNTIQGILERELSSYLNEDVTVLGSGRTDAGVHAIGQVANFHTNTLLELNEIKRFLNEKLPEELKITKIEEVSKEFHSRLSAVRKIYQYRVHNSDTKSVFERKYLYQIQEPLDLDSMREAAIYLIGTHDFQSFTSLVPGKKSTIRTIYAIHIEETASKVTISYDGSGFLYHMVRIMTGTLIEVGLHRRKPEDIKNILLEKRRELAGFLAPSNGLFLVDVFYE